MRKLSNVTLHVDPGTGISTLTAVGRVTANEVIAALEQFYAGSPTLLALRDLSQADLLSFSTEDVARIVAFTIEHGDARHEILDRCSRFRAFVSGAVGCVRGDHLASARHASLPPRAGLLSI